MYKTHPGFERAIQNTRKYTHVSNPNTKQKINYRLARILLREAYKQWRHHAARG